MAVYVRSTFELFFLPSFTKSYEAAPFVLPCFFLSHIQALIVKYSEQLGASADEIAHILEELRLHALAKLDEREKFQRHGLATLKVRVAGPVPAEVSLALKTFYVL